MDWTCVIVGELKLPFLEVEMEVRDVAESVTLEPPVTAAVRELVVTAVGVSRIAVWLAEALGDAVLVVV